MELDIFGLLDKTEFQARLFFKKYCWKDGHVFCTRCRSYKIYRIVNRRYRCKRCGYTFHDFSNRWINKLNISFKQWMWLIKLFELEIAARRIADQVRLSYPTVLKATILLRAAILVNNDVDGDELCPDGREMNDICFGNKEEKKKGNYSEGRMPVLGILKKDGMIKVRCIKCDDFDFKLYQRIKTDEINAFLSDDRLQNYDYLICCDYKSLKVVHRRMSSSGKHGMDGIESFLGYARERLLKFHGISKDRFALYMKEIEFRYNHRQDDLFILFAKNLCSLLPFEVSTH